MFLPNLQAPGRAKLFHPPQHYPKSNNYFPLRLLTYSPASTRKPKWTIIQFVGILVIVLMDCILIFSRLVAVYLTNKPSVGDKL